MKKRFPSKPLWLVTTNDNCRALRTYRRQGFVLEEVRTDAVARARRLKPTIPELGQEGIPIKDELILRYEPSARSGGDMTE
jgi:hypothetical protein